VTGENLTPTDWPGWNVAPAAGYWLVMVPAGSWLPVFRLLRSDTLMLTAATAGRPGRPAPRIVQAPVRTRADVTVVVCGRSLPAAGLVPINVPHGASAPDLLDGWETRCPPARACAGGQRISAPGQRPNDLPARDR